MSSIRTALLLIGLWTVSCTALRCRDEDNKEVDWYVVYKLPTVVSGGSDPGFSYVYMTSETVSRGWQSSKRSAQQLNSIFGKTLASMYKSKNPESRYTYLLWNDAPPHEEGNSYWAHAKGVVAMDKKEGFLLTHSIPNFVADFKSEYEYPDTGKNNGQTALCISFSAPQMADAVAKHLLYLRPNIYSNNVLPWAEKMAPNLERLAARKWPTDFEAEHSVVSLDGAKFIGFSKSTKADNELYKDTVAPGLETDLIAQTWRRGAGGVHGSDCRGKYKVLNAVTMNIKSNTGDTGPWGYGSDHSKWAISSRPEKPFVCIGDINRMPSQAKRGGGAFCIAHKQLWEQFRSSVIEVENC